MLYGVPDLQYIAGRGYFRNDVKTHPGISRNHFLKFDGNTYVACNTISTRVHNSRLASSFRKCLYKLTKRKTRRF
jgi:hypothetical protein